MSFLRTPQILLTWFLSCLSLYMFNPLFNEFRLQALAIDGMVFYEIIFWHMFIPILWITVAVIHIMALNFAIRTPSEFDYNEFIGNDNDEEDLRFE